MQTSDDHAHGVFAPVDSRALHRIYQHARTLIGDRIEIHAEVERRLASVVLFTYADALANPAEVMDEAGIVRLCVDRLMARTCAEPAAAS